MAEKLKQCPFCGAFAKAIIDPGCPWVAIKCTQCGAESDLMMENARYQDNEMAAISAWNNRAGSDETIEECAKTCEQMVKEIVCPEECAAAIRDMKES